MSTIRIILSWIVNPSYFLTAILLLSSCFKAFCQPDMKAIADEVCSELDGTDLSQSPDVLRKKLRNVSLSVYDDFPEEMENLQKETQKQYPHISEVELGTRIGNLIAAYLLETCPTYLRINQIVFQIAEIPEKRSLKLIGEEVCELLERNKEKSHQELDNLVMDNLFSIVVNHNQLIADEYTNGLENPDFNDDLIAYLYRNCEIYFLFNTLLNGNLR